MQAIWKFSLDCDDKITIEMPKGAKILCVQTQYEIPCIWAIIPDTKSNMVRRTFVIYGTGHEHESITGEYVGTFQLHGGYRVFHVFEEVYPATGW